MIWWVLLPLGARSASGWRGAGSASSVPLAAMFVLACFVYIGNSGTRYRAPFEPVFAVLACSAVAAWIGSGGAGMRRFWDRRARENPWFFITNTLDYSDPDLERFWASGEEDLDVLLGKLDAALEPSDHVVEIGCGAGRMTRAIARRVARVTALDVSPRMLEIAREREPGARQRRVGAGGRRDAGGRPRRERRRVPLAHRLPAPPRSGADARVRARDGARAAARRARAVPGLERAGGAQARRTRGRGGAGRRCAGGGRGGSETPAWVGSAVELDELRAAAAEAGLELERVVGEGTQYCFVRARRV